MDNPILLCEVAKLHQRDVDNEIALQQIAKQAQAARLGLIKRFIIESEFLLKKLSAWLTRETLSPDEYLAFNTKA